MIKKLQSHSLLTITALALMVTVLWQAGNAFTESLRRNDGQLIQQTLTAQDFEQRSMINRGEFYVATDSDPQLILVVDGQFTSVKFYMTSSMPTGEIPVYYTQAEGQDFSEKRHAWAVPVKGEDGWYKVQIPVRRIHTLRIDPTLVAGNRLVFGDFIMNEEKTFSDFLPVNYQSLPLFMVFTGFLWRIFEFIKDFFAKNKENHYKN